MLKITLVSYLNTQPFIEGLKQEFSDSELIIDPQIPSACPTSLKTNNCDMALIPVGSLSDFHRLEILKNYCIGADGDVGSVFLFSRVPIEDIDKVILDPHSRTSNALSRILLANYWKKRSIIYHQPPTRNFDQIYGKTAGVAIGDQAFSLKNNYEYVYDLAGEWKRWTGLPFVFAVWAAFPETLTNENRLRLNRAFQMGTHDPGKIGIKYGEEFGYSQEKAKKYLESSISFEFDWLKHQAFRLYLDFLEELTPLPKAVWA